jgi:hypothetical protein
MVMTTKSAAPGTVRVKVLRAEFLLAGAVLPAVDDVVELDVDDARRLARAGKVELLAADSSGVEHGTSV